MADDTNPIRTVYDALWDLLETKSEFTDMFPNDTPHQLRYTTDNSTDFAIEPDLKDLSPADYPRCRIVFPGGNSRLNFCRDASALGAKFDIEVCTGHQMQNRMMDAVWAFYLGLSKWLVVLRHEDTGVKWNSRLCVTDIADEEIAATSKDDEQNRGTEQWTGVFRITATLDFETADLIAQ